MKYFQKGLKNQQYYGQSNGNYFNYARIRP